MALRIVEFVLVLAACILGGVTACDSCSDGCKQACRAEGTGCYCSSENDGVCSCRCSNAEEGTETELFECESDASFSNAPP